MMQIRATYRLQLNAGLGFEGARAAVPGLADLGVSHLYLSPCFAAREGSTHGYDVIDYSRFDPAIGTRADFERLVAELRRHGMGLILDLVPNHMGVMGAQNEWWLDLLAHGRASAYAEFFDVDWRPFRESLRDRLLVPVLGAPFGAVLEAGDIRLQLDAAAGRMHFGYHQHIFPLDPRHYGELLAGEDDPELDRLAGEFAALPERSAAQGEGSASRQHRAAQLQASLALLLATSDAHMRKLLARIDVLNGRPGEPVSFDRLEALLDRQAYRLAYWRVASDEINYRRFFDINDLAALRVERPEVFAAVHAFVGELAAEGLVDGVRIDHADGLYDPAAYLTQLRSALPQVPWVAVEKILGAHEKLPADWPVEGTTGYEFARLATAWLIPPEAADEMTRVYDDFIGESLDFDAVSLEARRGVLSGSLASEVAMLANRLDRIARRDRHTADFTRARLREAIAEAVAFFPTYRTYVTAEGIGAEDAGHVRWALARARKHSITKDTSVFDFLEDVLTLGRAASAGPERRAEVVDFVMRFQQLCAPAMAKGVEDTAFYVYNRFVALNEVGGDPRRFGLTNSALHHANRERAERQPQSMLSTSTHDSKRSEDVRARLAALAECPALWRRTLARCNRVNRPRKRLVGTRRAPSRNDEYLFYQSLLGLWPTGALDDARLAALRDRLCAYMLKAAREANIETSWLNPDAEYEAALSGWINRMLGRADRNRFLEQFRPLADRVAALGHENSLAQTLLKLTAPGVPDIYQGCEQESLTLVDPDNRQPFDPASLGAAAAGHSEKRDLTRRVLALRRDLPRLFAQGSYEALAVQGPAEDCLLAYARTLSSERIVVVVPRFPARRAAGGEAAGYWHETWVEWPGEAASGQGYENVLTGAAVRLVQRDAGSWWLSAAELPAKFPAALIARRSSGRVCT